MSDTSTPGAAAPTPTPKQMARRLRDDLAARGVAIGHSEALELVAHQWGARDWNTLAARPSSATGAVAAEGPAVPILRIFDRGKAVEFYVDYLGFHVDWEHGGHALHTPLYLQVSRGAAVLHLSEHHGDASPGGAALVPVADVDALHAELAGRPYDFARPGVSAEDWGRVMVVIDPFHNRIVFHQDARRGQPDGVEPRPSEAAAPIELVYEPVVGPDVAFDAFTRRIGEWWHEAYSPGGLVGVDTGGAVGAPVTMALADGTTYRWGTVTAWEPGVRYAQTFTLAQDVDNPSTLDVRFAARPGGCTVRFAHGGWTAANLADRARFHEWDVLLDRFAAVAEGRPVPPVPASVLRQPTVP